MKDQYVGDFNDFIKYSLLRALAADGDDLAVCWMLTESDGRSDGRKTTYLAHPDRHRSLDPDVFDRLRTIVPSSDRSVLAIEAMELMPRATYFSETLRDPLSARLTYFERFWRSVPRGALVFFDPDNGFEVASTPKGRRGSAKFIYWDEVRDAYRRGHSVIVYQHFPRVQRDQYMATLIERLRTETGAPAPFAVKSPNVAFVIAASGERRGHLALAAQAFVARSRHNLAYVE